MPILTQANCTGGGIASFNRISHEDDRTVRHQDMSTTLVVTTWWHGTGGVEPLTDADFSVRRKHCVDFGGVGAEVRP